MGRFTFKLPDIGEGIAEAEIVKWHVAVGDIVAEDDQLADMMTDKATVEMESPVSGKVVEVAGEVGEMVAIGAPLVVIETDGEHVDETTETAAPSAPVVPEPPAAPKDPVRPDLVEGRPSAEIARRSPASPARADADTKILASPAVRKRARELGIDLREVRPASEGRIRHADLDAFLSYGAAGGYTPAGVTRPDETIKVIGLRKRIAQNMAASKRHIPHFSYVEECDVTDLEQLRADLNDNRGAKPKLTLLPLLIAAICRALPEFPMINARYDDEANVVTRHGAVHMGMGTMTDDGLMVPVIRDAQKRNLWQLAAEIALLAEAARSGTATREELTGSTLTITSLGPLGGIATTPVINRPEVAIIGPNRIVERPMFVPDGMGGERIAKRKLMNISISCDHRVVDGYDAAAFVQAVKKLLETPVLLLAD